MFLGLVSTLKIETKLKTRKFSKGGFTMNELSWLTLIVFLVFMGGLVCGFIYIAYKLMKKLDEKVKKALQRADQKAAQRRVQFNQRAIQFKESQKKEFNENRNRVAQSKEFQLTREIARILGKELKCIDEPLGIFQYVGRRLYHVEREVYDAESGEGMSKTNQGIVEDATYVDGDEQIIRLFKYLVIHEPQPAIELLKELFSISFGALSQTDAMGIDNSNRKEFLRNKIKEFCVRILDLCVYQSESAENKNHAKPEKKNVYMLR